MKKENWQTFISEKKVNILLVDDQKSNLLALEQILEELNENLVSLQSGKEALRYLLDHDVALILLDVKMPIMDGFEVASLIRKNKRLEKLPIIMVTAYSKAKEDVLNGYNIGINDYLFKPLIPADVQRKVHPFIELFKKTKANEKLIQELSKSNKELEQFAYVASHDLQAPLRHISSFVSMLDKKSPSPEEKARWMKHIINGTNKMRVLIEGLLVYSRIGTQKVLFKETDLELVLKYVLETLDLTIKKNGAEIEISKLPTLNAVETNMIQLFQNLIENALKFRHIDISPKIKINATERENYWEFSVHDNGIGIALDYQEKIFQIFQRLHLAEEYEGTGLGLSVCKKIVEFHGGRMWVDSQLGLGSTFYFDIQKNLT